MLEAAGNPDELHTKLYRGNSRLQGLPCDDKDVAAFKEGYMELRLLWIAVKDALEAEAAESKVEECKAQFAAALLALLLEAGGEEP